MRQGNKGELDVRASKEGTRGCAQGSVRKVVCAGGERSASYLALDLEVDVLAALPVSLALDWLRFTIRHCWIQEK